MPPEIALLTPLLDQTAELLSSYFCLPQADLGVVLKEDRSPVSDADKQANQLLVTRLQSLFPSVPVISEEEDLPSPAQRSSFGRFLLVDPLDGTKEFLRRSKDFATNIAFVEAGVPVWGVINAPELNLRVAGWVGKGAWSYDFFHQKWCPLILAKSVEERYLSLDRSLHSPNSAPFVGFSAVLSQSHLSVTESTLLQDLGFSRVTRRGSSIKFLRVAMGDEDVYLRKTPTWEWDTAAGHAILNSLGFRVFDLAGEELHYNKESMLNGPFVACHKMLHTRFVQYFRKHHVTLAQ